MRRERRCFRQATWSVATAANSTRAAPREGDPYTAPVEVAVVIDSAPPA